MTTDTATPAELVRGYEAQIKTLEARAARLDEQWSGRNLKSDPVKMSGVKVELEIVREQIEQLRDELAEARQAAEDAQRAAQERENAIASARFERARLEDSDQCYRMTLEAWALKVEQNRDEHTRLDLADPGDIQLSAAAIWAPIAARNLASIEATRQMMERGRAPDGQAERYNQARQLTEQIQLETKCGWEEAERRAWAVVEGEMTREAAFSIAEPDDDEAEFMEETDDEEYTLAAAEAE